MDSNIQSNYLKTLGNITSVEPTFYKNVDLDDMLRYLLSIRKLDNKHVKDIVSYFKRFRDLFFGPQPEEVLKSLFSFFICWLYTIINKIFLESYMNPLLQL
jgi:hypothetical protein